MTESAQPRVHSTAAGDEKEKKKKGSAGFMSGYFGMIYRLKLRPMLVALSKEEAGIDMSKITEIPKISEPNVDEVEVVPIKQNYAYVRISRATRLSPFIACR